MYIVRASYLRKPGIAWIDADPMQIASQICNVNCIGIHGDGTSFISTIRIDEITRYFEVFDCYCNRTYKLMSIKRTVEFSFLLKRGLILLNWEASDEATCIIDTQSEIDILPNDFYQKLVPVVRYRQMQSGCPVLTCKYVTKELEKYSLLYWNWHSRAVEFFSAAPYKRKLSYLECYDFQVKVINFGEKKAFYLTKYAFKIFIYIMHYILIRLMIQNNLTNIYKPSFGVLSRRQGEPRPSIRRMPGKHLWDD